MFDRLCSRGLACAIGVWTVSVAARLPADDEARGTAAMRVPDGFVVELVAGPPLVERPMLASFDDAGRLYVCDSAGVNLRGHELAKNPPHKIRVLEDTDGDGRFDRSSVFADKMLFPQGIVWHDGSVYCSSPPSFWKLTDTDGDGRVDRREELVTGFANTGVADDMHGGSLGPDGRIYWCAGRFPHEIRRPGGPVIHKGTAPLVLRCRPDGSDVEVVCGSQGNAVGVAFTREGDMFASGTFLAPDSMGAGLRDAVIHCVDGGEYPVRDRELHEHKRTGDLLPPLTHLGVSAASDILLCRAGELGDDSRGDLFTAQFNLHKVLRHRIQRAGATFTCRNEDFLASSDPDFHPTDVVEDADGSLLVVDTGGWFRIGCPTSQVSKPEVLGAIYRVRRKAAKVLDDPRALSIDWSSLAVGDLIELLADRRFAVRDRATSELSKQGQRAAPALASAIEGDCSADTKCAAVWALARIETDAARAAVRQALRNPHASVRQAAARAAGLHRDSAALVQLTELVTSDEPPVRREAATALGRIGDASAVPALLEGLNGAQTDRFLEHALVFALIGIDDRRATLAGLELTHSATKRGALIALDQMDDGRLTPEIVTPFLAPSDPLLRQTALWVIAHHGEWGRAMGGFFSGWLARGDMDTSARDELKRQLLAFSTDASVQELIGGALAETSTPQDTRLLLLEVMGQAGIAKLPAPWTPALVRSLESADQLVVRQAVATLRALPLDKAPLDKAPRDSDDEDGERKTTAASLSGPFDTLLVRVAADPECSTDVRVQAAAAVTARLESIESTLFAFLLLSLEQDNPPLVRLDAADALAKARLNDEQLATLCGAIAEAGVLEVPRLVRAFEGRDDERIGKMLVAVLGRSPGLGSLQADALAAVLKTYPDSVRQDAAPLFEQLTVDLEKQKARLAQLDGVLDGGDIQRGRELFFANQKAICATCHAVQGKGGAFGPDLTKIGAIRAPRDLLEAIVLPSTSFARGYESFNVVTDDGQVLSGIITRDTAEAIYLVSSTHVEVRVPRSAIESIVQSNVSIMPEGMDNQLSRQELADLIEFLHSLR